MARKNGCPMTVRDWQFDIKSRASTAESPVWLRIKGITSMTLTFDGDTEDGSDSAALYSEPYVSKRSGSLSLEGKPVYDAVTGAQDIGQAELDYYTTVGGCDGDAIVRVTDPYGHASEITVCVTSKERSTDDTEQTVSYDMEIVGETVDVPYVQVSSVSIKDDDDQTITTLTVTQATTETVTVAFNPATASNQKYSVASADSSKVRVKNVDGLNFDIEGIAATGTGGAVNVVVRSMNNSKEATLAVTVTAI